MASAKESHNIGSPDRPSGVRVVQRMLPLQEDIKHISTELLDSIRNFIFEKRRKIEKVIANDQGQMTMFPGLADDGRIEIPEDQADDIIEAVNENFELNGVELVRGVDDEGNGVIKLVRKFEKKDPQAELGGRYSNGA